MYSVSFNRKEVCKLSSEELQILKKIAVFWGLVWEDSTNQLNGRLLGKTVRIIGLNRKELNRLNRSLEHTQAIITTHPCHADLTLSVFKETAPKVTIKIESNNQVFEFEPPSKPSFQSVSDMIYKRFEPVISDAVKVYWNPVNCIDITEWLAYLILKPNESTELLQDVPLKTFESLLRNVLVPINPFLSSYQLKHYWPEIPKSKSDKQQSGELISSFKGKNNFPATQINPFKEKPETPSTTINPFKPKTEGKNNNVINPFFKK
ncbi:hypothetical protein [Pseudalkalibacillus salsuginis]|uniref:hypothetical protein n=1 Tax=Pseudalkalibacillus salsuginis TaxID=2910972 RepID=UPI001F399C81|nr:hypothetical protein [Pseudalkalibacillus salsuginis]MCF6409147.1 hypothetical protein [Pseudalkalibacillus salsuginis]